MKLDVNTKALQGFTGSLQMLSKSAFPTAVRNTLNDAAFGMKKTSILTSAGDNFPGLKAKTFFKRYTGVQKASGFSVKSMSAVVGFLNASDPSVRSAIEGMETQEIGGVIDDGLRYLKYSRGNRIKGFVQKKNYFDRSKVISGRNQSYRKGTRKSKFVARVFRAFKEGKPFFMNSMKGNFLVTVRSMSSNRETGKLDIKLNFLMMDRRVKMAKIKRTNFMREAAEMEQEKIAANYRKHAEYQFKKYMKK